MKPFILPTKIVKSIDKSVRNFFWDHDSNSKKLHTLKWDEIAKPKPLGGLGIRQASHQNKAIFLNNIWKILNSSNSFLSQVYIGKYGQNLLMTKSSSSFIFRNINKITPIFNMCVRKVISDGKSTSFWYENWLGENLRSQIFGPISILNLTKLSALS